MKPAFVAGISVIILLLLIASGCSSSTTQNPPAKIEQVAKPVQSQPVPTSPQPASTQQAQVAQPSAPIPQAINLEELFAQTYDESKTDLQKEEIRKPWVGKLIKSSGKVSEVSEVTGQYWVTIKNPNDFLTDLATVYLKSKDDALKIQKGDIIKFIGEIDGFGMLKGITIRNTEIVS